MKRFHPKALGSLLVCCLLAFTASQAQTPAGKSLRIKGTVRGQSDGQAVNGATILLVSDKKIATSTDATGSFVLDIPATDVRDGLTLEISSVGFEKKQALLQPGQSQLSILLENSRTSLNEVVVTALGIKKETKRLGYSVQEVKGADLLKAREPNPINGLVGKVAGVVVSQTDGSPYASTKIRVRGVGSINASTDPLYVIDGYPVGNDLYINPNDVESIDILKDAASAAIYGSRASGGVVLITTKRGKEGKT